MPPKDCTKAIKSMTHPTNSLLPSFQSLDYSKRLQLTLSPPPCPKTGLGRVGGVAKSHKLSNSLALTDLFIHIFFLSFMCAILFDSFISFLCCVFIYLFSLLCVRLSLFSVEFLLFFLTFGSLISVFVTTWEKMAADENLKQITPFLNWPWWLSDTRHYLKFKQPQVPGLNPCSGLPY